MDSTCGLVRKAVERRPPSSSEETNTIMVLPDYVIFDDTQIISADYSTINGVERFGMSML